MNLMDAFRAYACPLLPPPPHSPLDKRKIYEEVVFLSPLSPPFLSPSLLHRVSKRASNTPVRFFPLFPLWPDDRETGWNHQRSIGGRGSPLPFSSFLVEERISNGDGDPPIFLFPFFPPSEG